MSVEELAQREAFAAHKNWSAIFGRFSNGTPCRCGSRAVDEFLSMHVENFHILLLSDRVTAFQVSMNSRRCAVLACNGPPVNLSTFNNLEFGFARGTRWLLHWANSELFTHRCQKLSHRRPKQAIVGNHQKPDNNAIERGMNSGILQRLKRPQRVWGGPVSLTLRVTSFLSRLTITLTSSPGLLWRKIPGRS